MKYLVAIFFCIALIGCRKKNQEYKISFAVESRFLNDSVIIILNNDTLFNKSCTTIDALGLAAITQKNVPTGEHTLLIKAKNQRISGVVKIKKDTYIQIRYQQDKLGINISYKPPAYD